MERGWNGGQPPCSTAVYKMVQALSCGLHVGQNVPSVSTQNAWRADHAIKTQYIKQNRMKGHSHQNSREGRQAKKQERKGQSLTGRGKGNHEIRGQGRYCRGKATN